jgi:GSCFA family
MNSRKANYSTCPYNEIDPSQRWDRSIASVSSYDIDPGVIGRVPALSPTTRIGAAGSCFAQYISETLRNVGYNFFDAEPPPQWLKEDKRKAYGYGIYSARYGNIYTALQLTQLLQRSLNKFAASDEVWAEDGRFLDPFRPRLTPSGYPSLAELVADREDHLNAVQRLFKEVEVFVFTLGLTETWLRNSDGAALPVCPGCGVGEYDSKAYSFKNFDVSEVTEHLTEFMSLLASVNPNAKVILTVSPVPLAASFESHNVLLSTSYSKAVLRVAAQAIVSRFVNASYFPSYEIITQTFNNSEYFETNRRNVTAAGVSHVMRCFFRHVANADFDQLHFVEKKAATVSAAEIVCDEEELARALAMRQIASSENSDKN